MAFNEKQTAHGRSLKFIFFNVFPTFGAQAMTMAATMALNRRLHMHARFNSFLFLLVFLRKTTRKVMIKNWRFWDETQTCSRERSNSKRARTKFKLIGKFKRLRKFLKTITEGLAFLARSLSFFFVHWFIRFCMQNKKSNNKKFKVLRLNLAMKYEIQNARVQSSN